MKFSRPENNGIQGLSPGFVDRSDQAEPGCVSEMLLQVMNRIQEYLDNRPVLGQEALNR